MSLTYLCTFAYMYVCMYVCIYIYIDIYRYIYTFACAWRVYTCEGARVRVRVRVRVRMRVVRARTFSSMYILERGMVSLQRYRLHCTNPESARHRTIDAFARLAARSVSVRPSIRSFRPHVSYRFPSPFASFFPHLLSAPLLYVFLNFVSCDDITVQRDDRSRTPSM